MKQRIRKPVQLNPEYHEKLVRVAEALRLKPGAAARYSIDLAYQKLVARRGTQ